MLYYTLIFLVLALIAAAFGFGGIAAGAATIAQMLFIGFLVVALLTGVAHLARGAKGGA